MQKTKYFCSCLREELSVKTSRGTVRWETGFLQSLKVSPHRILTNLQRENWADKCPDQMAKIIIE